MQLNGNTFEKVIFGIHLKPKSFFLLDMFNLMRQWLYSEPPFQGPHFLTIMLESNILYDNLLIDILSV